MSTRTSHRRAAGKKSRQEKYLPGEKIQPKKSRSAVRKPDENRDWHRAITGFAACEKCFVYSLTLDGLCLGCSLDGDAA